MTGCNKSIDGHQCLPGEWINILGINLYYKFKAIKRRFCFTRR